MSILIICQKLAEDDDLLGAFVAWVRAIAKNVNHVDVVCLAKGEYHLPDNCEVYSLGKEKGTGRVWRWIKFVRLMFKLMSKCDVTFSHMSPIFSIVSWPFVKLYHKKATLWYAHGHAGWKIKLAEKCVDVIFTSTPEGCRIASDKIRVVGQGIDINKFQINEEKRKEKREKRKFQMVSIGRIAPSKDYETMIEAVEALVRDGVIDFEVKVIGRANLAEHDRYFEKIKQIVKDKGLNEQIKFLGVIPNDKVMKYYQEAEIYLNMSHTGSLDRAIVEAMACGCVVLTCNEGATTLLKNAGLSWLMYVKRDYEQLAGKINEIMKLRDYEIKDISEKLRREVVENHSVEKLGEKITSIIDNL